MQKQIVNIFSISCSVLRQFGRIAGSAALLLFSTIAPLALKLTVMTQSTSKRPDLLKGDIQATDETNDGACVVWHDHLNVF